MELMYISFFSAYAPCERKKKKMIKKLLIISLFLLLFEACGKKGDPVYKTSTKINNSYKV